MATESITECAVAIYLAESELEELGLHIPVSAQDAKTLISNAMLTSGRQPWGKMEVDMFTYDDSVLLLARPSDRAVHCFVFDTFEDLLGAVGSLPRTAQSTLIWMDGAYYLFLGVNEVGRSGALFEFGRPVHCSEGSFAHIAEHGDVLLTNRAIFELRKHFFDVRKM